MAVRVDQLVPYGYTDTAISTFHAFGDGLIREYALELGLPTDVRVLSRPEVVIFLREHLFEFELDAYRPLGDPTRFLAALATLFSRCKDEDISPADYEAHADRVGGRGRAGCRRGRWHRGADARRGRDAAEAVAEEAGRQARAGARLRHVPATAWPRTAASTSATRSRWRCGWCGRRPRPGPRSPAASGTCSSTSSRTRTGPRPSSSRSSRTPHRNVTVVGDDDQAIYAFRGAAVDNILAFQDRYVGARGRSSSAGTTDRCAPILDAAYRLIRFNDPDRLEVRTGIVKRLRPRARRAATPRPVRLEVFASGSEEADWIAAEIGRRIAAGRGAARPRRPRPGQRPCRPDPARPEHGRRPVAVLRHVRPVRATRGPAAAGVPARRRRPGVERRRLRPGGLGPVRPGRRGPDGHREHGPAAQPIGLGGARASSTSSPGSCGVQPGDAGDRAPARRGPARRTRRPPTSSPPASSCTAFLRGSGLLARLAATDSVAAEEALQNIARFFEIVRAQSALLADDRAIFVAPTPGDAHRGRRRSRHGRARPGCRRCRGADRAQGQGPRVPRRLPARAWSPAGSRSIGRGETAGPAGRTRPRGAADAGDGARRGATAVLRGDDPGARRADPVATPRTTAAPGRGASRRSCSRRWTCRPPPASPAPGRRRLDADRAARRVRGADGRAPAHARRPDRRAAVAELLPDRRLPDLPAQVQVRPRPAGAAGAASRDHLRRRAAQGRPAVPPPTRQGPGHDRGRARRGRSSRPGRTRASSAATTRRPARGRAGRAAPVPDGAAPAGRGHPDLRRARVQLPRSAAIASAAGGTASTSCRLEEGSADRGADAGAGRRAPTSCRRPSACSGRSA